MTVIARPAAALALAILALAGCVSQTAPPSAGTADAGGPLPADQARRAFAAVVADVEPVAETVCRERARRGTNCDLDIVVVTDPRQPPNAFQTRDRAGRPVVGFTIALIEDARNRDEIAFILGHEAAHHIAGHLDASRDEQVAGGLIGGLVAVALGADAATARRAAELGGAVNARRFSKAFELEADALGTIIAGRAGYDPVNGARFFDRVPDPGDRFLGTHPLNAERIAVVRRTAAAL